MNQRKLALSVALGVMFTLGLLAALTLNSTAEASASFRNAQPNDVQASLTAQDTVSTAYIVVRFGDHDSIVRAITFTNPVTVYAALQRTGLDIDVIDTDFGKMLCGIEGVGSSLPDGSACDTSDTRYWSTLY
ncbi:MAG: hypothetical protein ACOC7Y_00600, partial [Chloroflexota bacterium]